MLSFDLLLHYTLKNAQPEFEDEVLVIPPLGMKKILVMLYFLGFVVSVRQTHLSYLNHNISTICFEHIE